MKVSERPKARTRTKLIAELERRDLEVDCFERINTNVCMIRMRTKKTKRIRKYLLINNTCNVWTAYKLGVSSSL